MSQVIKLPKLMTRQEAAAYLGVSVWTLNAWASRGGVALPFYRVGRRAMYKQSDVLAFLEASKQGLGELPTGGGQHDGCSYAQAGRGDADHRPWPFYALRAGEEWRLSPASPARA